MDGSYPGRFLHVFSSNWLGLCLFAFFQNFSSKTLAVAGSFSKNMTVSSRMRLCDRWSAVGGKRGAMSARLIYLREEVSASAFGMEHNGSQKLGTVNSDAISASETVES